MLYREHDWSSSDGDASSVSDIFAETWNTKVGSCVESDSQNSQKSWASEDEIQNACHCKIACYNSTPKNVRKTESGNLSSSRNHYDEYWKLRLGSCVESDSQRSEEPAKTVCRHKIEKCRLHPRRKRQHSSPEWVYENSSSDSSSSEGDGLRDDVHYYPLRSIGCIDEGMLLRSGKQCDCCGSDSTSSGSEDYSRNYCKSNRSEKGVPVCRQNSEIQSKLRRKKFTKRRNSNSERPKKRSPEKLKPDKCKLRRRKSKSDEGQKGKAETRKESGNLCESRKNGWNSSVSKGLTCCGKASTASTASTQVQSLSGESTEFYSEHDSSNSLEDLTFSQLQGQTPDITREQFSSPPRLSKESCTRRRGDLFEEDLKPPALTPEQFEAPPVLRKVDTLKFFDDICTTLEDDHSLVSKDRTGHLVFSPERMMPHLTKELNLTPLKCVDGGPPVLSPMITLSFLVSDLSDSSDDKGKQNGMDNNLRDKMRGNSDCTHFRSPAETVHTYLEIDEREMIDRSSVRKVTTADRAENLKKVGPSVLIPTRSLCPLVIDVCEGSSDESENNNGRNSQKTRSEETNNEPEVIIVDHDSDVDSVQTFENVIQGNSGLNEGISAVPDLTIKLDCSSDGNHVDCGSPVHSPMKSLSFLVSDLSVNVDSEFGPDGLEQNEQSSPKSSILVKKQPDIQLLDCKVAFDTVHYGQKILKQEQTDFGGDNQRNDAAFDPPMLSPMKSLSFLVSDMPVDSDKELDFVNEDKLEENDMKDKLCRKLDKLDVYVVDFGDCRSATVSVQIFEEANMKTETDADFRKQNGVKTLDVADTFETALDDLFGEQHFMDCLTEDICEVVGLEPLLDDARSGSNSHTILKRNQPPLIISPTIRSDRFSNKLCYKDYAETTGNELCQNLPVLVNGAQMPTFSVRVRPICYAGEHLARKFRTLSDRFYCASSGDSESSDSG